MDINAAKNIDPSTASKSIDRPWRLRADNSNNVDVQSRKFVSQVFFGTLLKQMRSSVFGSSMFNGGSAGKSYNAMFDQQLADNMSNSPAGRKIAENLAKSILKNKSDGNLPNSLEEARKSRKTSPKSIHKSLKSRTASDAALNSTPSIDMKG